MLGVMLKLVFSEQTLLWWYLFGIMVPSWHGALGRGIRSKGQECRRVFLSLSLSLTRTPYQLSPQSLSVKPTGLFTHWGMGQRDTHCPSLALLFGGQ